MSLDQNLFTLNVTQNKDDANVLDLIDPAGRIHYHKQRVPGPVYKINIFDPLSESLLATATAPSATSKHKTVELYNPTVAVELNYTGKLSFRWAFKWEEHEFEWKREECFMLRKPDPPVLVAVTREPPGKIQTTSVQILDYNLNRFDIEDRKGLEILILTALLTFSDNIDVGDASQPGPNTTPVPPVASRKASAQTSPPPVRPPKPAPKTGIDRIVEMQALRGEINEIMVEDEGVIKDYANYCSSLLQDEAMLFISVRSASVEQVPKVLQVVEQTKRIRHKAGIAEDEELFQYVIYDSSPSQATQKGPKRINLDDDNDRGKGKGKAAYSPPKSLTVHLSKIPMPELQPKSVSNEKLNKESKASREPESQNKKGKDKETNRPSRSSAPPSHPRVHSYQTHPNQPSPSPSQLNNPGIYAAPPPRPPQAPYTHPQPVSMPKPNFPFGLSRFAPPPGPPPHLTIPGGQPGRSPSPAAAALGGFMDRMHFGQR